MNDTKRLEHFEKHHPDLNPENYPGGCPGGCTLSREDYPELFKAIDHAYGRIGAEFHVPEFGVTTPVD